MAAAGLFLRSRLKTFSQFFHWDGRIRAMDREPGSSIFQGHRGQRKSVLIGQHPYSLSSFAFPSHTPGAQKPVQDGAQVEKLNPQCSHGHTQHHTCTFGGTKDVNMTAWSCATFLPCWRTAIPLPPRRCLAAAGSPPPSWSSVLGKIRQRIVSSQKIPASPAPNSPGPAQPV